MKAIVERINFSWEQGFLNPQEYADKITQLKRELESLRPVDYDDLMEAADLIEYFSGYWQQCSTLDRPEEARKQLLAKIVDRVFVYDDRVIAITLYGDFSVILDEGQYAPQDVVRGVAAGTKKGANGRFFPSTRSGDDGLCPHSSYVLLLPSRNHAPIIRDLLTRLSHLNVVQSVANAAN